MNNKSIYVLNLKQWMFHFIVTSAGNCIKQNHLFFSVISSFQSITSKTTENILWDYMSSDRLTVFLPPPTHPPPNNNNPPLPQPCTPYFILQSFYPSMHPINTSVNLPASSARGPGLCCTLSGDLKEK